MFTYECVRALSLSHTHRYVQVLVDRQDRLFERTHNLSTSICDSLGLVKPNEVFSYIQLLFQIICLSFFFKSGESITDI